MRPTTGPLYRQRRQAAMFHATASLESVGASAGTFDASGRADARAGLRVASILAALLLSSCTQPSADRGSSELPANTTTVPMILHDHRIYVQGYLNKRGPFLFLFDTGGRYVVSRAVARELSATSAGSRTVSGAGGSAAWSANVIVVRDVAIGTTHLADQRFSVFDFPTSYRYSIPGQTFAGMVGYELLSARNVELDFDRNLMTISPATTVLGGALPLRLDDLHHPIISASIGKVHGNVVVDTGYPGPAVELFRSFASRVGLERQYPPRFSIVIGRGLGGYVRAGITRLPSVSVGDTEPLRDVLAAYSTGDEGAVGSDVNGFLPEAILESYNVTFSYKARAARFLRNHRIAAFAFDRAGMYVQKDEPNFVDVVDVVLGGPAWDAGLRSGDRILAVDGKSAAGMTLETFRQLMTRPVGTCASILERKENAKRTLQLCLRDLI